MSQVQPGRKAIESGITLGQVSGRKGAKAHLVDDGAASCHAGATRHARIIAGTTKDAADVHAGRICKRCLPAILDAITAASRENGFAESRYSARLANLLSGLAETVEAAMTPTQHARRAAAYTAAVAAERAQFAESHESWTAAKPVAVEPVVAADEDLLDTEPAPALSGWGAIVAGLGTTPQGAAVAHAARRVARGGRRQGRKPSFARTAA